MKIERTKKVRPTREVDIRDAIRLAVQLAFPTSRLFVNRQFSGLVAPDDDGRVRWVEAGLGEGSPDLVGFLGPYFLAFEVKRPGAERAHAERVQKQRAWLEVVAAHGGIAAIVSSPEQAVASVGRWLHENGHVFRTSVR